MAKSKPTQILCNSDALSRAADAILSRGEALTKNAILNALAAAVAGPGHDWGLVKNAPGGIFAQPGLTMPGSTAGSADPTNGTHANPEIWVLHYDEENAWSQAPLLFSSKAAGLSYVAETHSWWRHNGHHFDHVMSALNEKGEYTFTQEDNLMEETEAYRISLRRLAVEPDVKQSVKIDVAVPVEQPDPIDCPFAILADDPGADDQDIEAECIYADEAQLREDHSADGLDDHIWLARDCSLTATFHPQAWQRDYAIDVDAEGETEWEIEAQELKPGEDVYDYLQTSKNAPKWAQNWEGPFEIRLSVSRKATPST